MTQLHSLLAWNLSNPSSDHGLQEKAQARSKWKYKINEPSSQSPSLLKQSKKTGPSNLHSDFGLICSTLYCQEAPILRIAEDCNSLFHFPNILTILVRCTEITLHLAEVFLFHQEHLQSTIFLQTHEVLFTTDVLTSPNVTAFLAVTAHFLDVTWNLTSVLLGLNAIEGKQFIQKLEETSGSFNAAMQHIGCMAHIIHLAARDGLNALSLDSSSPDNDIPPDNWINNCMSKETLVNSPDGMHLRYNTIISKIARLASYLNQSPQWRDKFITTACFVYNGATPTHAALLLLHVSTRWNSTYDMLEQALTLKDSYNQFTSSPAMDSYKVTPL
ncbi:hypothetical protein O181_056733 [Austropuccinia psidii MF-1]|uniref:Uncharacterized protein n=1 Tax=Austropuccinia psidii MF-1 TaxID=1389203 RepID=A0A9Q3EDN1_9BASI|nr:hypothetical protein [Austropuccinia psidii MF-1]